MQIKLSRMHEQEQPLVGQITMARFDQAEGSIIYIKLVEYDNKRCLIPFQNLGIKLSHDETVESGFKHAFMRSADNKYSKQFPVRVVNAFPIEVDLNVGDAEKQQAIERFSLLSRVHEMVRQVALDLHVDGLSMESIYAAVIWHFENPVETLQSTIQDDAFQQRIQPLVDAFYASPASPDDRLLVDSVAKDTFVAEFRRIQKQRFELRAVTITAELMIVSRWSVLGIQAIKSTLIKARDAIAAKFVPDPEKNEEPFTITILTAPKYQVSFSICRKDQGKALLNEFIALAKQDFQQQHVDFECTKIKD